MKKLFFYIYWAFLTILLTPESILAFVSGIFLSAAVNIATSAISKDGISELPSNIVLSMILMFIACILFMLLAVWIKPIQESYKDKDLASKKYIRETKKSDPWYEFIKDYDKKLIVVLPIILLITMLTCVLSIVVLFKPTLFIIGNSIEPPTLIQSEQAS